MNALLDVRNLRVYFSQVIGVFRRIHRVVRAIDGVSLLISQGEILGVVGESGCGKTTLGRAILRLILQTTGTIFFDGQDIAKLRGQNQKQFKQQAQIVFQDPYSALNPRMMVLDLIGEPLRVHRLTDSHDAYEARVVELMEQVGLEPDMRTRYPHEFSGGQRQRIVIARALISRPKFLVCDEPTSALDVSVQAEVVNLLRDLQRKTGLTMLFISHSLPVVEQIATRIAVMYLGKIVEIGLTETIFQNPIHPYTQALISAVPIADPAAQRQRKRIILTGDPPSPANPPSGCAFHPRCPVKRDQCSILAPSLRQTNDGREVACHFAL